MLLTLEEIGVEAAMILATVAALVCFVALLACVVLERRETRRIQAERTRGMRTVVQRTRTPHIAYGRVHPPTRSGSR
jgi:hypothetical protein